MKKSELRNIIKEEIQKVLKENTSRLGDMFKGLNKDRDRKILRDMAKKAISKSGFTPPSDTQLEVRRSHLGKKVFIKNDQGERSKTSLYYDDKHDADLTPDELVTKWVEEIKEDSSKFGLSKEELEE